MGQLRIMDSAHCKVDIEWRDQNLRITQAIVTNTRALSAVLIEIYDDAGLPLWNSVFLPGTTIIPLPGSASRRAEITTVNGSPEITLFGFSLRMSDPAPLG